MKIQELFEIVPQKIHVMMVTQFLNHLCYDIQNEDLKTGGFSVGIGMNLAELEISLPRLFVSDPITRNERS